MILSEQIRFVFKHETLATDLAVNSIAAYAGKNQLITDTYRLGSNEVSIDKAFARIRSRNRRSFHLCGPKLECIYGEIRNSSVDFLLVKSALNFTLGSNWMESLLSHPDFVIALVTNADYEYWQNATDPTQFDLSGRQYSKSLLIPNGLPPPLNRLEIDISKNPGRIVYRRGYVEAVGSFMWIGDSFWEISGFNKTVFLSDASSYMLHDHIGVITMQFHSTLFTSPVGAEGDLQNRIRSILFPSRPQ